MVSKRINENGAGKKVTDLGGGQTLETPYGKDSSDFRGYSDVRLRGGMNNLSDTLPADGKVSK